MYIGSSNAISFTVSPFGASKIPPHTWKCFALGKTHRHALIITEGRACEQVFRLDTAVQVLTHLSPKWFREIRTTRTSASFVSRKASIHPIAGKNWQSSSRIPCTIPCIIYTTCTCDVCWCHLAKRCRSLSSGTTVELLVLVFRNRRSHSQLFEWFFAPEKCVLPAGKVLLTSRISLAEL